MGFIIGFIIGVIAGAVGTVIAYGKKAYAKRELAAAEQKVNDKVGK
jgi:hypothetical protein